jgi:carboxymethylenebutenolidase
MSTTRDITFPSSSGRPMRAAIAAHEDDRMRPGVIVIHELFGLNDDIRKHTARIADLGYVGLAPDLYDAGGMRALCVMRTLAALRSAHGRAFDDLDAARVFLQKQPHVDASRVGVIGFCMGGGFALLYAVRAPLGAAAVFYGDVPKTPEALRGVCPVVAGYGGRDRIYARHGDRLDKLLGELGVDHDVKVYPEAGHSFMSRHEGVMATLSAWGPMKVGYNQEAAEDSWKRVESFFGRHLGGK